MALATRPKPNTHHRKRQGGHHRHSKGYLKTYWPYLPMLMTVGVGLVINSVWSGYGHVLGAQSDYSVATLLADTNQQRTTSGETALALNTQLSAAAQAKADDMAVHNYWSHDTPSGQTPWSFITAAGYSYSVAGENLAYGFSSANETVAGWMNSPDHRANVLGRTYQAVGFGVSSSPDYLGKGPETIVVAEYAAPATGSQPAFAASPTSTDQATAEVAAQSVSRIQLLTGGQAVWSTLVLGFLVGAALAVLLLRHGRYWQRVYVKSEAFLSHHPLYDILLVVVVTCGYILTRTGGVTR